MKSSITRHITEYLNDIDNTIYEVDDIGDLSKLIELNDVINGIFSDIGNNKITMPNIVVVGMISSGKSTLLNRIIGFRLLPTGINMITKTPIEIKMKYMKESYTTVQIGKYINGEFSCVNTCKINLSPNETEIKTINQYLIKLTNNIVKGRNTINKTPIVIMISSPNVKTFSLVDLPGFIPNWSSVDKLDESQQLIKANNEIIANEIKKLATEYIKRERTIVMAIVQANKKINDDVGIALVKEIAKDQKYINVCCVLTKPDLLENNCDEIIFIKEALNGKLKDTLMVSENKLCSSGYFVVNNNTIEEAKYFEKHYPDQQHKCGLKNLVVSLTNTLVLSIKTHLPKICEEIEVMENNINDRLGIIGDSINTLGGIYKLVINALNFYRIGIEHLHIETVFNIDATNIDATNISQISKNIADSLFSQSCKILNSHQMDLIYKDRYPDAINTILDIIRKYLVDLESHANSAIDDYLLSESMCSVRDVDVDVDENLSLSSISKKKGFFRGESSFTNLYDYESPIIFCKNRKLYTNQIPLTISNFLTCLIIVKFKDNVYNYILDKLLSDDIIVSSIKENSDIVKERNELSIIKNRINKAKNLFINI